MCENYRVLKIITSWHSFWWEKTLFDTAHFRRNELWRGSKDLLFDISERQVVFLSYAVTGMWRGCVSSTSILRNDSARFICNYLRKDIQWKMALFKTTHFALNESYFFRT